MDAGRKRKSDALATKDEDGQKGRRQRRAGVGLVKGSPPEIRMNAGQEMGQMQKKESKKKQKERRRWG